MGLIDLELSEPYSIFTYRYFLHNWPRLCFLAYDGDTPFGCIVCKQVRMGPACKHSCRPRLLTAPTCAQQYIIIIIIIKGHSLRRACLQPADVRNLDLYH